MDYFSKLARRMSGQPESSRSRSSGGGGDNSSSATYGLASSSRSVLGTAIAGKRRERQQDAMSTFMRNWEMIKLGLETPDQRSLHYGIARTDLAQRIQALTDSMVFEHNRIDEDSTGSCMEYVLRADVLGTLVQLSEDDKPAGIKKEVIRAFANLTILLDERFLYRQAVHQAILRLMSTCIGDEDEDELMDEAEWMLMDEERASARFAKSAGVQGQDYEEDLVDLLCHICSRVRNAPELLSIFLKPKRVNGEARNQEVPIRPPSPAGSDSSASTLRAGQTSRGDTSPQNGARAQSQSPSVPAKEEIPAAFDFPIFTYLLRFIHREGKIGEVARAGALFCINLAMGKSAFASAASCRSSLGLKEKGSEDVTRSASRDRSDPTLALAHMILESDFAEVFGASLGAVYGLLPSKLAIRPQLASDTCVEGEGTPQTLGMSIGSGPKGEKEKVEFSMQLRAQGIEYNDSPFVRAQVKVLENLLDFAQDVFDATLEVTGSSSEDDGNAQQRTEIGENIADALANAIRHFFLQNILYPSMLECSDADWSAVAVMSYVEAILLSIEDSSPLANVIIGYLAADDASPSNLKQEDKVRRRKSVALLAVEGQHQQNGQRRTSYFTDAFGRYTLKDLILGHITPSTQQDARTAALRLATTLFERHGRFAIKHLTVPDFDVNATAFLARSRSKRPHARQSSAREPLDDANLASEWQSAELSRSIMPVSLDQHFVEMRIFFALIESIAGSAASNSSFGFEQCLLDVEDALGRDSLFAFGMQTYAGDHLLSSAGDSLAHMLDSLRHHIKPADRFYRTLIQSLAGFFTQSPEVNVALTGLLGALSLCPLRAIEGWLVFSPGALNKDAAPTHQSSLPIVLFVLYGLAQQVDGIRNSIPEFDSLLSERRLGLNFVDNLQDAIAVEQDDEVNLASPRAMKVSSDDQIVDQQQFTGAMKRLSSDNKQRKGVKVTRSHSSAESVKVAEEPEVAPTKPREGFMRWFAGSGARSKGTASTLAEDKEANIEKAVPFALHYAKTDAIEVEMQPVKLPPGPWSATAVNGRKRLRFGSPADTPDEDRSGDSQIFYPGQTNGGDDEVSRSKTASLSAILDNVIILQETIKELAAIVRTRRSVGIDAVAMPL
ncbi:hypothetical protein K437DRAFT_295735 [Tilletiaria anomala UBC 951]|uniref:FHF complex subunit HOOK-interacting protein C-terminal domain-containing protein n=1 Tax=Tilletiaria anomala (strain ATCC 24038 / CBS 436.72 / UBC 951) TaxID=1037660 RepID=A0A066VGN1_TILAU|nr:uncharacterized protein K437DRAFT_295735 [Tilletiaria anomala UBC 951]KDN40867.1 hypothetical protein K437DRAFT_295735 [Tilletiaria anomala UBC 951]